MLRSYLRLAIRTLRRRLGYTAVNALGLTVGLACCALVAVFLQYELSWDRHHENADRTYRLLVDYRSGTRMNVAFPNFRRSGPEGQRRGFRRCFDFRPDSSWETGRVSVP